jgi:protein-S-isoprenylcysteine O-methyltransferase
MLLDQIAHLDNLTRLAYACGVTWAFTEVLVMVRQRSRRTGAKGQDRGSLVLIILPAVLGIALACLDIVLRPYTPIADAWRWLGFACWALGLGLRRWAIAALGRFFTVDVSIHGEHQLIQNGPYRWLRHPSYTGFAMILAGIGLMTGHPLALALFLLPPAPGLFWRIRVEEGALRAAFGPTFEAYAKRTWRLIPAIY